ncbi:hypothetical protein O6H91_01G117400 [Diphasiastrum complanatum]|uniref:Uncharacterized protein n=1 Tax=Diphasiastrum complanatum TaxID=34168 RepID=A0ACC2EVG8_DIPCM|nr:hypothetical protein O6H91_01G117400 [Diphasiastrum complanatum]
MGTGWRKAKNVLALHACASAPKDELPTEGSDIQQISEAAASKPEPISIASASAVTPSRTPSRLQLIRTSIRLSRHGNLVCPVCRAKWTEVPWQAPVEVQKVQKLGGMRTRRTSSIGPRQSTQHGSAQSGVIEAEEDMRRLDPVLRILDESIANARGITRISPPEPPDPVLRILDESIANARGITRISPPEPSVFNDDEPLHLVDGTSQEISSSRKVRPWDSGDQEMPSTSVENSEVIYIQAEDVRGLDVIEESGRDSPRRELESPTLDAGLKESDVTAGSGKDPLITENMSSGGEEQSENSVQQLSTATKLELRCHAETGSLAYSKSCESFTVLVHLKAAAINRMQSPQLDEIPALDVISMENSANLVREESVHATDNTFGAQSPFLHSSSSSRAPLDLVTVLDVSGSMAGTKLLLLKRAMAFVIQNLSPADRLSVVAFSSTAKRLFPLRRMGLEGRQQALQAIDALVSTGGTNIAEGLRKGAKVLKDRREHNPVASIMLLSDGQDTYSMGAGHFPLLQGHEVVNYRFLVPRSLTHDAEHAQIQIPVHTFGFGADHDAATMHSISEVSGGTFSFIQAEGAVQDAFAQCIGGLLSVVLQDVQLSMSTHTQSIELKDIQAGSYESSISDLGRSGTIKLGYLYAEEERDILCELKIPALAKPLQSNGSEMQILKVKCTYKDPVSQEICQTIPLELSISRPDHVQQEQPKVSLEVDRQRNRLHVAQAIVEAKSLADAGDIEGAQRLLHNAKLALQKSEAFRAGDQLSKVLETELIEIQVRMANRQMYERLGRAYILSAQSSHFRQRATTRGESVDGHSRDYQTPSMIDMVLRSQTISFPSSSRRSTTSAEICSGPTFLSSPRRIWLRQTSGRVGDAHPNELQEPLRIS